MAKETRVIGVAVLYDNYSGEFGLELKDEGIETIDSAFYAIGIEDGTLYYCDSAIGTVSVVDYSPLYEKDNDNNWILADIEEIRIAPETTMWEAEK